MGAPRKFDQETRERAVRMYQDRLGEVGGSKSAARRHVAEMLDINQATLRNWIEKDTPVVSSGVSTTSGELDAKVRELRRENSELRRANEILKTASAFFAAAEIDRRLR